MAVESNKSLPDSLIINFNLLGIDDKQHSLEEFDESKIFIIVFMCNHCPYVKAIIGRLVELQNKYKNKRVQLLGINSNDTLTYPEDSFENMKLFAKEHNINFPYLFDETQNVAREYDAVCTPDIFVYNTDRKLEYRGRFDDNWKDESSVNERDLEKAVELILAGKKINFEQVPSLGCSIKWK